MKIKGMWLDGNPNQQPSETSRINKNIVATDKFGSISNERGFEVVLQQQLTQIGIIRLDANDFVVFSTNDVDSEITLISDDKSKLIISHSELNFSLERPIHGTFFLNNKKERIVTWTDGTLRSINIDNPANINQLNSFNPYKIPEVKTDVTVSGNLQTGSYQIALQFVAQDGSLSNWIKKYAPVYVSASNGTIESTGSESGTISNKGLTINVSKIDSNYQKLRIGFVYQNKNVSKFYYVKEINIDSFTTTVHINGSEKFIQFPLDELIIDRAVYKTVDNITSFEQVLFVQGLTTHEETNQQTQVSELQFNWKSERVDLVVEEVQIPTINTIIQKSPENYKQGEYNSRKKSFQHDEVYAIYIRFKWNWGYGKWWVCSGRQSVPSELVAVDDWKKYQVEDTCALINKSSDNATGTFSFWENEDESYNIQLGVNTKVRHFKFPSLNWMKNNVYTDTAYGTKYLDTLGIVPLNLNLNNFKDSDGSIPESYEIGFAKRENTRVVSQSLLSPNYSVNGNNISLGGNWLLPGFVDVPATKSYRTWPFDLLHSKKEIFVNYARVEWFLRTPVTMRLGWDQAVNQSGDLYNIVLSDFTRSIANIKPYVLEEVVSTQYVEANSLTKDFNNLYLEEFLNVNFKTQPPINIQTPLNIYTFLGLFNLSYENVASFEQSGLITLLNIQKNYYVNYYSQQIVNCDLPVNGVFYGDTFLCDSSINAYGVSFKEYTNDETAWRDNRYRFNYKKNGTRAIKRYLFQSKYNANLRYNNPKYSLQTSFYNNHSVIMTTTAGIERGKMGYMNTIRTDINPNDFVNGYDVDMHTLNTIEFSEIWNPRVSVQNKFPFRIAQSQSLNNELEVEYNAWRDFKLNNYYELVREKGTVKNIVSGNDFLYIHFQNSLYRTKPRGILQPVEGASIQLGYGEIFQFDPVPIVHSELGEMGTNHKWSCLLTAAGYIFFDSDKGKWFLVGQGVDVISSKGLYGFFNNNKYCAGDNPFTGNGYFSSYDERFNRILITKKNKKLKPEYDSVNKGVWKDTPEFINSLKSGDLVLKNGIWKQIL